MREQLDIAVRAAQAGGAVLARFRHEQTRLDTRHKKDGSIVTDADQAASAAVREVIMAADGRTFILDEGEEHAHDRVRPRQMWIVDPLDGTAFYAQGDIQFCTMVAWVSHGTPIVGAIHFPSTNTTYFGGDRLGVFVQVEGHEPTPIHGRRIMRLDQARMTGPVKPSVRPLYERIARALVVEQSLIHEPSGGMYAAMLENDADIVITRRGKPAVWDVAAGHALLRGVGGALVDLHGDPIKYRRHTKLTHGSIAAIDAGLIPAILSQLPPYEELI